MSVLARTYEFPIARHPPTISRKFALSGVPFYSDSPNFDTPFTSFGTFSASIVYRREAWSQQLAPLLKWILEHTRITGMWSRRWSRWWLLRFWHRGCFQINEVVIELPLQAIV